MVLSCEVLNPLREGDRYLVLPSVYTKDNLSMFLNCTWADLPVLRRGQPPLSLCSAPLKTRSNSLWSRLMTWLEQMYLNTYPSVTLWICILMYLFIKIYLTNPKLIFSIQNLCKLAVNLQGPSVHKMETASSYHAVYTRRGTYLIQVKQVHSPQYLLSANTETIDGGVIENCIELNTIRV